MSKNPIRTVDGKQVKCPTKYQWKMQDISAADSGRTEDLVMHKNRIGQVCALELSWENVSIADGASILKSFDPEYLDVCYLDAKSGTFQTKQFYVGDRAAPLWDADSGVWREISFNIIERKG